MVRVVPRTLGGIVAAIAATLLYGFNWPLGQAGAGLEPVVRVYLLAEQARAASASFDAPSNLSREQLQALADAADSGRRVTITGLDVRGTMLRAVARVTYQVDGRTPPDGRPVRYLRLHQSGLGDWTVDRSGTALSYYFLF